MVEITQRPPRRPQLFAGGPSPYVKCLARDFDVEKEKEPALSRAEHKIKKSLGRALKRDRIRGYEILGEPKVVRQPGFTPFQGQTFSKGVYEIVFKNGFSLIAHVLADESYRLKTDNGFVSTDSILLFRAV